MTQKEKQLLLKYLCAALPYGVKIEYDGKIYSLNRPYLDFMRIINGAGEKSPSINECKPYLRSMSSMTEEEKKEFDEFVCIDEEAWNGDGIQGYINQAEIMSDGVDWLNSHHFDYRGLIEKGLAIEAPVGMYKTE